MQNFSTSTPLFSRNVSLNIRGRVLDLTTPKIMGIINVTPDSFYQGSRLADPEHAVYAAKEMISQGADMLDVGAVSSRPGAGEVDEPEELERLTPVLEAIRNEFPDCVLSVDTFRSKIARTLYEKFSIDMINDISAGTLDSSMFRTVVGMGIPYVLMHMQGSPPNMQEQPTYTNVVDDLLQYFGEKVYQLRKLGINDVIMDPGFGFGKTLDQNFTLLSHLEAFRILELPLMVGISRKSMIYKTLESSPEEAMNGTTAAHMAALLKGANILRVHDVREAAETVKIFNRIVNSNPAAI